MSSSAPFAGLSIFLHIRDNPQTNDPRACTAASIRRDCCKLSRQLGATLTISEGAADIIVASHASPTFLDNVGHGGRTVVSPDYLRRCARARRRLAVDPFLVVVAKTSSPRHSPLPKAKKATTPTRQRNSADPKDTAWGEGRPVVKDVRAAPFLLDDEDSTSRKPSGRRHLPYLAELDEEGGNTNPLPPQPQTTNGIPTPPIISPPTELMLDDALRHAVLRSIATATETKRPGTTLTDSAPGRRRKRTRQDPFLEPLSSAEGTPPLSGGTTPMVTQCLANRSLTLPPCSTPPQHHFLNTLAVEDPQLSALPRTEKPKSPTRRKVASPRQVAASKKTQPATAPVETQLTMHFTDITRLAVCTTAPSSAMHIALMIVDGSLAAFLTDVVEQLGATLVPRHHIFGRHRKPTHVVIDADAELTPETLLAKALGVYLVVPQWLMDAIAIGGVPVVLPDAHMHPIYSKECVKAVVSPQWSQETSAEVDALLGRNRHDPHGTSRGRATTRGGNTRATISFLTKGVADEQLPIGQQWERPFYRPLLKDMCFFLHVSADDLVRQPCAVARCGAGRKGLSSPSASALADAVEALEQVTELVRVLGGTVTRNRDSHHLDMVLDLSGFYTATTAMPTARTAAAAPPMMESLTEVYSNALLRVNSASQPTTSIAASTSPEKEGAPPVVGVGWLVYVVMHRELVAVQPFILRIDPAVTPTGKPTESRAAAERTAPLLTSASVSSSSDTQNLTAFRRASMLSPSAKVQQGPQQAMKEAQHQWGTQRIAEALKTMPSATASSTQQKQCVSSSSNSEELRAVEPPYVDGTHTIGSPLRDGWSSEDDDTHNVLYSD